MICGIRDKQRGSLVKPASLRAGDCFLS